jgi:hypothetical protein
MKRAVCVFVVCFIFFIGANAKAQTTKAADLKIEWDYSMRIMNYKLEIIQKSTAVKSAVNKLRTQSKLENLDMTHRGRVPYDVRQQSYRAEDMKRQADRDFEALGKEIVSFKSEVIKYYKGNVPEKLNKQLNELTELYQHDQKEIIEY